ncbi:hypothetical protein K1719_029950 [Acacia pycnantha]|nr:hypothetical protein K1719_029950 [Acacia pycnantha]
MVREKVKASTRTLQWKCVESRANSKRLYYGRFILSPLRKGQADTIGIAMRRALLGEIEGTCITRAKSEKIPHEYSTIAELPPRIYNCLKRSNIHTLLELFNNSQEDLMKMEHLRIEDVKCILDILEIEKHFA